MAEKETKTELTRAEREKIIEEIFARPHLVYKQLAEI